MNLMAHGRRISSGEGKGPLLATRVKAGRLTFSVISTRGNQSIPGEIHVHAGPARTAVRPEEAMALALELIVAVERALDVELTD